MARRKGARSKPRGSLPPKASVLRVQQGKEKYPATTREGQYTEEIVTVRRLEGRQMVSGSVGSVERAISMLEANNFSIGVDKVAGIVGCNPGELQRALEARGYRWLSEEGKVVRVAQQSNEVGARGLSYGTATAEEMISNFMERKSVSRREAINSLAAEGSLRTLSEVRQPQPRVVSLAEKQAQSEQAGIRAEAKRIAKESGGKISYQDALRVAKNRKALRDGKVKV
jgi:hypothetical protein